MLASFPPTHLNHGPGQQDLLGQALDDDSVRLALHVRQEGDVGAALLANLLHAIARVTQEAHKLSGGGKWERVAREQRRGVATSTPFHSAPRLHAAPGRARG